MNCVFFKEAYEADFSVNKMRWKGYEYECEIWGVVSNGYFSTYNETIYVLFGARPVVEIARSEFEED